LSGTLFTLTLHAEALQVFTPLTLVLLDSQSGTMVKQLCYCCPDLYLQFWQSWSRHWKPAQVGQFLLSCKCPVSRCRARTRPPWWYARSVFPSKCPSVAPAVISNTLRW
jgi:hypothetical protein